MSQYGMQMPGGRMKRTASMNVYTGLLFVTAVALAAACVFMWKAGQKVGPEGNGFKVHPEGSGAIRLASPSGG